MNPNLDFTPAPIRIAPSTYGIAIVRAGMALARKTFDQVEVSGHYQAARNLRKQGFSLELALALVARRV